MHCVITGGLLFYFLKRSRGASIQLHHKDRVTTFALRIAIALQALALSSCSPLSLFGTDKDKSLGPSGRQGNPRCQGLDLSGRAISPPAFRKVINCLNGNNSIDPIARLVQKLNDAELKPTLEMLNEAFLSFPERVDLVDRVVEE